MLQPIVNVATGQDFFFVNVGDLFCITNSNNICSTLMNPRLAVVFVGGAAAVCVADSDELTGCVSRAGQLLGRNYTFLAPLHHRNFWEPRRSFTSLLKTDIVNTTQDSDRQRSFFSWELKTQFRNLNESAPPSPPPAPPPTFPSQTWLASGWMEAL